MLNISHSLAILLYILSKEKFEQSYKKIGEPSSREELKVLYSTFDKLMEGKRIRNKKAVANTFRRVLSLAQPNKEEVHALITALKV